ncbi:MAG TPA: sigma-54-dependent Fis family transcriptional regulator, partial [Desulfobacteraceae bacterium]|nr:sigma-54-dependent Fis family transcriptional regulator [Desulfobacteraceae bacterium]
MNTILVVDDEKNYLVVLETLLRSEGYEVITADNAKDALEIVLESDVDLVLTDMKMPGISGMELLETIKRRKPDIPVIMMTAYGTIEMAVEAMKKNAYDYITKPFKNEELKRTIRKAIENYTLLKENRRLSRELRERYRFANIIGKSKPMLEIFSTIEKIASSRASVLITGESGTGKELIAKAIHYSGSRKDGPFISVNCGALTETLLESELFGHERGAFTGAIAMKKGRFELADKGTLFLDEIGDMPASLQVKLLRVLQEMEFERVGGTRTIKVDVRIISASNKTMKEEVEEGRFREDLFYRLNVIHIHIPPLRERVEDIKLLVNYFIDKYSKEEGKEGLKISADAWKALYGYHWPGNVRELENVIERAVVLNSDGIIDLDDLPLEISKKDQELDIDRFIPIGAALQKTLEEIE